MIAERLALGAALALERGEFRSPLSRALGRVWAASVSPVRPVALPRTAAVVGVGGATLGGSHKTPLVLALARAVARQGARVAVVGHGHGASVRGARVVAKADPPAAVGDDAAWLARALAVHGVPVVVGRSREEALHVAARLAPLVLVDSLLQASPERLALSLLAVDADAPFGAGSCPPAGDLRSSAASLLAAADCVVAIGATHSPPRWPGSPGASLCSVPPLLGVPSRLLGADPASGARVPLESLRGMRVGLVLAIARPARVVGALHAHGIFPVVTRLCLDHSVPTAGDADRALGVEAWLTSAKCATKLGESFAGAPLLSLAHELAIPASLLSLVLARSPGS